MVEYPSLFDFFLRFKVLVNDNSCFTDYMLVSVSNNFQKVTNIKCDSILGKKLSEITLEYESDFFAIKDIYYNTIPKTRRKFEKYIEELDRWYSITIFSDDKDYLLLFYNDISRNKKVNKPVIDIMDKVKNRSMP